MTTEVSNLENVQQLEVAVSGPDGANRLILCSGIVPIAQQADAGSVTQTWAWRVGPVLSRLQFRRAIAQGGLIRISQTGGGASWSLIGIDAEWDGESGQVDVRAKIQVIAQGLDTSAGVQGISYQVSILAAGGLDTAGTPTRPPTTAAAEEVSTPAASAPLSAGPAGGAGGLARERRVAERRSPASRGAASRGPDRRRAGGTAPPTEPEQASPPPPPAASKPPAAPEGTLLIEKLPTPPPPAGPSQGASRATMTGEKIQVPPPPPPGLHRTQDDVPAAQAKPAPPPVLVLAPPVLDFGGVPVGGFRAKTLTITNTGGGGSGPLEMVFGGADAGEFTLTVDPVASANLPPGASGHLLISFQPASAGPKTASLQIRTLTGAKVEATIVGSGN